MANGFLIPNGALCVVGEGVVVQGRRFEFHVVLTRFSVLEVVYLAHPGPGIALNGDCSQASGVGVGVGTGRGLCFDMELPL